MAIASDLCSLNDETLAGLAQMGNAEAEQILTDRWTNIAHCVASEFTIYNMGPEDNQAIALEGLLSAIRSYRPNSGSQFKTYVRSCMNRRLIDAYRSAGARKHLPPHMRVDIDGQMPNDEGDDTTLADSIPSSGPCFTKQVEDADVVREVTDRVFGLFRRILLGVGKGSTYLEIAENEDVRYEDVLAFLSAFRRCAKRTATISDVT